MGDWISRRGVYDNDFFSSAQCTLYIGDVLVDELTSLSFAVHQSKTPLYGYASELFDAVSKGNVLVQGQFSINFKEAGYLWLILNRYKAMNGEVPIFDPTNGNADGLPSGVPAREMAQYRNIEQVVNGNNPLTSDTKYLGALAREAQLSLSGFSNRSRQEGETKGAESIFEAFENYVWGKEGQTTYAIDGGTIDITDNRRCDVAKLNPFDIYVVFGDYVGDDRIHHTIQKIVDVHILGNSKQIGMDGTPVQEVYQFFAKDIK